MRSLNLPDSAFRALAQRLADFSADYLERMPQLPTYPTGISGRETEALFSGDIPWEGRGAAAFDSLDEVFRLSRPASPRFFGYVFGSGDPIGVLGEFATAVLHQNAAAWRSAPAGVTIERIVVRWLASALGCDGFTGSLTLGGSSANLMGLCMAREAKVPANQGGARGGVIYCSTEAHMSIAKAAALLGLGYDAVRLIPVDKEFRMGMRDLRQAIRADLEAGRIPIAVVGSAGTTATGSIDPLDEIVAVCREFGLWMHVDGAYGALASLAIPEAFRGLEGADSVSLDPHKWLYQPTGCGCLLYREPEMARARFLTRETTRVSCPMIRSKDSPFSRNRWNSRGRAALKLWLSLRYYGLHAFQQSIKEDLELAQMLVAAIDAEPALERLAPVPLSAVCFRYVGSSGDLDALNREILVRVIRRGRVYISNTIIDSKFALRACIVNHRTTGDDVKLIVSEVLAAAREAGA